MDLILLDSGISYRISDLSCLDSCDRFFHLSGVFLKRFLRHIADKCCNTLRNCFGRNYNDLLIFCQISCLVCCQNDILVVRKNIDCLRIDLVDRVQHILCTRVHSLTALDQIIYTKLPEDVSKSVTCGHCNKSDFLCRLLLLLFLSLLFRELLRILDQLLLMFFSHVIDLHTGKSTISQSPLDRLSRMVGVYMNLDNLIICDKNDGITKRSQKFLKFMFFFQRKRFIQKNNKLCTVAKFNISLCLWRDLRHCRTCSSLKIRIINFLAKETVDGTS